MREMRLICGKFEKLDLSEIGPVDLCIADPPDNVGKGYDGYADRLPKTEYQRLIKKWLRRCCEITNGPVFFTFAQQWIWPPCRAFQFRSLSSRAGRAHNTCPWFGFTPFAVRLSLVLVVSRWANLK